MDSSEDPCSSVTYSYHRQTVDPGFTGSNLLGRLAAVSSGCSAVPRAGRIDELYSYNVAGAVVRKRLRVTRYVSGRETSASLDIDYTYDSEGKLLTTRYPRAQRPFVMTYDPMGRLNGMTQEVNPMWNGDEFYTKTWVNGVTYGLGGELRTFTD